MIAVHDAALCDGRLSDQDVAAFGRGENLPLVFNGAGDAVARAVGAAVEAGDRLEAGVEPRDQPIGAARRPGLVDAHGPAPRRIAAAPGSCGSRRGPARSNARWHLRASCPCDRRPRCSTNSISRLRGAKTASQGPPSGRGRQPRRIAGKIRSRTGVWPAAVDRRSQAAGAASFRETISARSRGRRARP